MDILDNYLGLRGKGWVVLEIVSDLDNNLEGGEDETNEGNYRHS